MKQRLLRQLLPRTDRRSSVPVPNHLRFGLALSVFSVSAAVVSIPARRVAVHLARIIGITGVLVLRCRIIDRWQVRRVLGISCRPTRHGHNTDR